MYGISPNANVFVNSKLIVSNHMSGTLINVTVFVKNNSVQPIISGTKIPVDVNVDYHLPYVPLMTSYLKNVDVLALKKNAQLDWYGIMKHVTV
jgi:hypothetical protein